MKLPPTFTNKKAIYIIIIVGFIVFFNVLFNGFVWDDKNYVINTPNVNANFFTQDNAFNSVGQYRPIIAIYFSLVHALFGNTAFFYHLLQISLHIAGAAFLFLFFSKFFDKKISLFASLVFLVHPIQVESVAFIAATAEPLVFLLGMIILQRYIDNLGKNKILIASLFFIALLAKETGILLILLVLLYCLLFKKERLRYVLTAGAGSIGAYLLMRFLVGKIYFGKALIVPIARLSLLERIMHIPAMFFYYLKTFFFPSRLAIDQLWTISTINFHDFYFPILVDLLFFVVIGLLGLYVYKKNKKIFSVFIFFFLWFLVSISMFMQIHSADETVADRWFYFPIVGLLGILATWIQSIKFSLRIQKIGLILGIILIVILSARTIIRNANWSDAVSLYTHDMKIGNNFDLENHLAAEYLAMGRFDDAIDHFNKSISFFSYDGNVYNLAFAYEKKGDILKAKEYYQRALDEKYYGSATHKHDSTLYISLARILVLYDKPEIARDFSEIALVDYPDSVDLWKALAVSEYKLHNQDKALRAADKARTLQINDQTEYLYNQISNNLPLKVEP